MSEDKTKVVHIRDENDEVLVTLEKDYTNLNNVSAEFASEMTVTLSENVIYLSFYRVEPPLILDKEKIKELKTLNADLVAKVIVTPNLLKGIIDVAQQNLEKHKEWFKDKKK